MADTKEDPKVAPKEAPKEKTLAWDPDPLDPRMPKVKPAEEK